MHNHVKYDRLGPLSYRVRELGADHLFHEVGIVYKRHQFSDEHGTHWVADATAAGQGRNGFEGATRRGAVSDMLQARKQ